MKQKAQAKKQLAWGGLVLAAALAVLLLVTVFLSVTTSGLEKNISDLTARKKELQKALDLIVDLEKKKALVEEQIGVVHELQKKSQLTVHILDEVARITPHERMWLTSLTQNSTLLTLNGMALDNRTIASYLEGLKDSSYLENVSLGRSTLSKYGGRNLKGFSLSASVVLPGTDDDASKDKEVK